MPTIVQVADFRARYPEFSEIDDAVITTQLDDAEADTSPTFFDTLHPRAIAALAAHRIAISTDEDGNAASGQPGALSQATVDGVAATYELPDNLSPQDLALWSTTYGQLFLELRSRFGHGPSIVG